MGEILVLHSGVANSEQTVDLFGRAVVLRRMGCGADVDRARALIREHDGRVAAIALVGFPARLQLGAREIDHDGGADLVSAARETPVLDGSGVRPMLERWAVSHLERSQPGIFRHKRVLMVPGLNHPGLADGLSRFASAVRYVDPAVFFGLPRLPGVGSSWSLDAVSGPTLALLRRMPVATPLDAENGEKVAQMTRSLFREAEVLAGDVALLRTLAPEDLSRKTVVVEHADEEDLADLARRGARIAATLMPSLDGPDGLGQAHSAVIEALLASSRETPGEALTEDSYLDQVSEIEWRPAVRHLQPEDAGVNRFAFVIHPLDISFIHRHPEYWWTRFLPDAVVERIAARMRPHRIATITGGESPATGQRIEGHLITLGATPRQMMGREPEHTYGQLHRAARIAEKLGARIMGLGAFTSVVGDAGMTVARDSPIAITSGNSLTVAATLEAAKQAAIQMGIEDLTRGRAMIVGATGSIGSVCARMIAKAVRDVVLVSIEPEKLISLKRTIREETPGARVAVATRTHGLVDQCDLIITATSGFGQRILDISECKPGAIICDVARPPDISNAEAALRPDVLVIESGEVLIPGEELDVGYNIGLPPKVVYACLAETALLTMEGRFENYTLGRELQIDRVKEIYRLFNRHGFRLAGLRSLGRYLSDDDLAEKRQAADALRQNVELFEETRRTASRRLAELPAMSKGVQSSGPITSRLAALSMLFGSRR